MARTIHSDIPRAIHSGASCTELNQVIQSYLDDNRINKTVSQWRIENYAMLRRWAYPAISEYIDAQIKMGAGISQMTAQGRKQCDDYIQACLDVKTRFPKE